MARETELERMVIRLVGDGASFQRMLKQAEVGVVRTARVIQTAGKKIEAIGRSIGRMGKSISAFGRSLTLRVTAPLLLFGGLAVRVFAKFDQAMTESTSIMKVTEGQTKRMKQAALDLSSSGALQGPEELAKSYFFLASAGKDAEQSMALLPKVAEFATAGAFDMALATDLLTDAQSALGLSSKDTVEDTTNLTRVSDVLVKANTLANASVQQFATALTSKAGTAMKSFGIELEDGVALLAAYADQGIKAELAGNTFSRAILLLTKAARDNAPQFKKMGITVFNSKGEFREMADVIEDMENALGPLSTEAKAAALTQLGFAARIQQAILPLLGTSKAVRKYREELLAAKGITQEVAEKQMKSFSNQMVGLKNKITAAAIEIGEFLAPTITKISSVVERGVKIWKDFTDGTKRLVLQVLAVVAAAGPLLTILGGIAGVVSMVVIAFGVMISAMFAIVGPLIAIILAILSPLGVIAAGFIAIGVILFKLVGPLQLVGGVVDWFMGLWEDLVVHVSSSIQGIKDAIGSGDIELAFEILGKQMELLWAETLEKMKKKTSEFIGDTTTIAGILISAKGFGDYVLSGFDEKSVQNTAQTLRENATIGEQKAINAQSNITRLQTELHSLNAKAGAAKAAKESAKLIKKSDPASIKAAEEQLALSKSSTSGLEEALKFLDGTEDTTKTAIPKTAIPKTAGGELQARQGVGRGVEAASRIAQFREGAAPSTLKDIKGTLEKMLELEEKKENLPVIEIKPAELTA